MVKTKKCASKVLKKTKRSLAMRRLNQLRTLNNLKFQRKQRKPQPATSNAADVQPFDGPSTSRYPSLPITPTPISPTISTPPIKKRQRNSQVIPYSDRLTRLQSRLSKSLIANSSPALPRPRPQPPPRVTRLQLRLSNSSIAYSSPALPPPPNTVTDVRQETDEVFEDLKIEIKGHFLQNEVNFNEADDQLNVTQNGLFSIKQENCDEEHTESLQQIFNQDKNDADTRCDLMQQNFNTQSIKVMDVKNELDNGFEDIKIEIIERPLEILKKEDNFNEEYAQLDVMQNEIFPIKQEHMNDADIKCN